MAIKSIDARFLRRYTYLVMSRSAVTITERVLSTVIGLRTRTEEKIMNEHRHAQRDVTHSLSIHCSSPFLQRAVYIYIYIQRLHLLHARRFAGKTRARQRRAYTSPSRPSKFSRGRQVRGPSAAKSALVKVRAWQKKVGWQRASLQIRRDFVTWHKGRRRREVVERGRKGIEKKGRTNRPFRHSPLSRSSRTCADLVPRSVDDRFDCDHLSSSAPWEMLLNFTTNNISYLLRWLWIELSIDQTNVRSIGQSIQRFETVWQLSQLLPMSQLLPLLFFHLYKVENILYLR